MIGFPRAGGAGYLLTLSHSLILVKPLCFVVFEVS